MFKKVVIVEHVNMLEEEINKLNKYANEVIYYDSLPKTDEEIIKRIDDADCVLVSYTTIINSYIIDCAKNIKYIGMCCSLYSPSSANVDIEYANKKGIVVKGVRDYGDIGVIEYITHELVGFLGGYNGKLLWDKYPREISSLKCSVIGLGTSGTLIAKTLKFFGADVIYYSRTRKPNIEKELNITYKSLDECVKESDAIFLALNKNVLLLDSPQFELMDGKKILFNTSIGPGFHPEPFRKWIQDENHFFFGDTLSTIGDVSLFEMPNTFTINRSSGGSTYEAYGRLGIKVIENIIDYQKSI